VSPPGSRGRDTLAGERGVGRVPIPTRGIPGIPGNFTVKIPLNSEEFRMFFKKFRIPPEVKKALPWTP
jgi:hypothetical protein